MACKLISGRLVAFAMTQDEEVEAHLMTCPACLQAYFDVKRALFTAETATDRPRPAVRRALEAAFVGGGQAPAPLSLPGPLQPAGRGFARPLASPIPVFAAVALALAVAAAVALWRPHLARHPSGPHFDGASPSAQNLETL